MVRPTLRAIFILEMRMDDNQIVASLASDKKFWKGVEFYKKQFKEMPQGISRAYSIQKYLDEVVQQEVMSRPEGKRIACKQGCSHCCYLRVEITNDEADLLMALATDWSEEDKEHLRRQAKGDAYPGKEFLAKIPFEDRRCPFLKNNECSVYEHRPALCRTYFAADTNEGCKTESGKMSANTLSHGHIMQVISAAGMASGGFEGYGLMATKLLERMK